MPRPVYRTPRIGQQIYATVGDSIVVAVVHTYSDIAKVNLCLCTTQRRLGYGGTDPRVLNLAARK